MTIQEAMAKLREAIPYSSRRSINVTLSVFSYDHLPEDELLSIEFRVWDGVDGFSAPTLEHAVEKCLVAQKRGEGSIEEAETAVAAIQSEAA